LTLFANPWHHTFIEDERLTETVALLKTRMENDNTKRLYFSHLQRLTIWPR